MKKIQKILKENIFLKNARGCFKAILSAL